MKKTYKIEYPPLGWECRVTIDPDQIIESLTKPGQPYTGMDGMLEQIKFWVGGDDRLEDNGGNVVETYLQQLGREIILVVIEYRVNVKGVRSQFENREGWAPMDGSWGIEIEDTEDLEFEQYDFQVKEVTNG